jgi:large subunit ribosomal protein L14
MIQPQSLVKITDNSGGKVGRVFKILGGSKKRYARIGDVVVLSIQTSEPRRAVKKKDVLRGVVVRQKQPFRRRDGSYIRFDDNSCVLLDENEEMQGTRVFGPVARELREHNYMKVISLAPEVL